MIRALIVDDEPLARIHLRRLLERLGVDVVGEAGDALAALQMAEDLQPDLLTLDIQMPAMSGMQMAGAMLHLDRPPLIVFVTAYIEHAISAFENDALDYLVKPVELDRLAKTLVRVRERLADRRSRAQMEDLIQKQSDAQPPLRRLPVRGDYAIKLVRVEDISCTFARDKRVHVRTDEGEFRTYYTLMQLEALLPSDRFARIHDSCIVNLDRIEELIFLGNHSYSVKLSDGLQLPVGRTRYAELQRRLGMGNNGPA
jgi:two-component system, LytTR family, response regulator